MKTPIDLGTIQKRLAHGQVIKAPSQSPLHHKIHTLRASPRQYRGAFEFARDVRLVWANAQLWNAAGSVLYQQVYRM